ncbi:TlpA family protein disulfide reductase [Haloplanus halobius]|uniref:TlpA family protein disulfide reductase n=1 Tax=Haloplanus halobius TaxID=2934938 RepID=UPI00200F71AD|nr:TlpA disulfide reductase family protein [Haloplanus sp. XH21]
MNRRRVLTALAGIGLTGGSVWAMQNGLPVGDTSGLPVTVETIDASGSEAGQKQIPVPGTPTIIDLFATWCAPCKEQMDALSSVYPEYANRVTFVSVTNERVGGTLSKDDIREWWRNHDGNWTVGLDPESDLMSALGAGGLPYLAIVDASGTVRWEHGGVTDVATLRAELDRTLDST